MTDKTEGDASEGFERRDRHDVIMRSVALVACLITFLALIVSGYQVWTIRNNASWQLRAYVGAKIEILDSPKNEIFVWIENFGLTPAKEIKVFSSWEFVPQGQALPDDFTYPDKVDCGETIKSSGTLFPKTAIRTNNFICPAIVPSLIKVQHNEMTAAVYGKITYKDIFNNVGETTFCFMLTPTTNPLCERHNDIK